MNLIKKSREDDLSEVLRDIDAAIAADRHPTSFEQTQQFYDVLASVHEFVLNRIEDQHVDITAWSLDTVSKYAEIETANFIHEWHIPINEMEMRKISEALVKELTGFGPLEDLLNDPEVEDILVNGYKDVYVSRRGLLELANARFTDNRHLLRIVRRFLVPLGRRLDESNPMVDARLPNGGRLNAIIEPLSVSGPTVSIRKFRKEPFTPDDLMARHMFDPAVHALLRDAVLGRCNIVISGGTSSGKTSLLNALASFIPCTERVITVEDTAELSLNHPHVVRLESRLGGADGAGEVNIRDLVRNSLRMRPDRIVVGEVRGAEVLEMLQAMNTGHDGSMSTIHANSARDALYRLEMLCGFAGFQGSESSLRRQIASAIDFIIQITRLGNGRRVITSITEVIGTSDDVITTQEMYRHESVVDLDGVERDRWPGLGFQPHSPKLEPYRRFLREAGGLP
jgi:pilus assembly protein CpaF